MSILFIVWMLFILDLSDSVSFSYNKIHFSFYFVKKKFEHETKLMYSKRHAILYVFVCLVRRRMPRRDISPSCTAEKSGTS